MVYLTHGATGTSEHNIWRTMLRRCSSPTNEKYAIYGGRGIKVCERWLRFECFLSDMGPRPGPEYSLERIDNNKGYEPGNVKWATPVEQQNNRRDNAYVTYQGRTLTVAQWAREVSIPRRTLHNRLFLLGWSPERALTTPSVKGRNQYT